MSRGQISPPSLISAGTSPLCVPQKALSGHSFQLELLAILLLYSTWGQSWSCPSLWHAQHLMHSSFSINVLPWMLGSLHFLGWQMWSPWSWNTRWTISRAWAMGSLVKLAGLCLRNQSSAHQGGSVPSQIQRPGWMHREVCGRDWSPVIWWEFRSESAKGRQHSNRWVQSKNSAAHTTQWKSYLYYLQPWASYLTSLCLHPKTCFVGKILW